MSNKCLSERRRRKQIEAIILADSKTAFIITGKIKIIITV
jgi:hypothetical protein